MWDSHARERDTGKYRESVTAITLTAPSVSVYSGFPAAPTGVSTRRGARTQIG